MIGHCQGSDEDMEEEGEEEEFLSCLKVPQLKELCRAQSLKVSGSKAVLIARLLGTEDGAPGRGGNAGKVLGSPHVDTYPTAVAAQLGKDVLRELRDAVADDSFMGDGGLIGVPCMHLYEQVWI